MLTAALSKSGDIWKLIVNGLEIDSALHAICRSTLNIPFGMKVKEPDTGNLAECVPCTVPDVHQFSRMAYGVRNSFFNLPNAMMYPKFRYTLRELTKTTGIPQLMYLDPMLEIDGDERIDGLRGISDEWTTWVSNLDVYRVINTAGNVLSLPLYKETRVSVTSTIMSIGHGSHINLTFKECEVTSVSTERDRNYLLRLIAAECNDVPARSMLLLLDDSIPLEIIPGFTRLQTVIDTANLMSS